MKLKFSQFDNDDFDPTEGRDDAAAWEENQIAQETETERQEEHDDNPLYVTVYWVERRYGGPEEGGWWYEYYEIAVKEDGGLEQLSFPVDSQEEAEKLKEKLSDEYPFEPNELSSVNGIGTHLVIIEDFKGEMETTTSPHYE